MTAPQKIGICALVLCGMAQCGCGAKVETKLSNGTHLAATSDARPLAVDNTAGNAVITAGDKTIAIKAAEVLLDGETVAKIPGCAASLQVARYRGRVCVVADGQIIFDSVRR